MSLTEKLFGRSDAGKRGEEGGQDSPPGAISFAPLKKTDLDLFAKAPQMKIMSRRDKRRLEAAALMSAKSKKSPAASKEQSSSSSSTLAAANRSRGIFETAFSSAATGSSDAASAAADPSQSTPAKTAHTATSRRKVLRHALHKNEEEDARTVFVGNLPNLIKKREVEKVFKECGPVESVRIRCQALEEADEKSQNAGRGVRVLRGELKKDDRHSAAAYVLFRSRDSVAEAVKKNGVVLHDRHVVVTSMDVADRVYAPETSIFLGNVAYDTTEEDVWRFFAERQIADVKRVRLVRDRESGDCKGFGYVEFMHRASVGPAIETRGGLLNGRPLRIVHVNKAKEQRTAVVSRREKRRQEQSPQHAAARHGDRKRGRDRGEEGKKRARSDRSTDASAQEESFPWMGVTTNPRKKMPRDLRGLAEGNRREARKAVRTPVKHKLRNPEKHGGKKR